MDEWAAPGERGVNDGRAVSATVAVSAGDWSARVDDVRAGDREAELAIQAEGAFVVALDIQDHRRERLAGQVFESDSGECGAQTGHAGARVDAQHVHLADRVGARGDRRMHLRPVETQKSTVAVE